MDDFGQFKAQMLRLKAPLYSRLCSSALTSVHTSSHLSALRLKADLDLLNLPKDTLDIFAAPPAHA